jgi:hypothetical protein
MRRMHRVTDDDDGSPQNFINQDAPVKPVMVGFLGFLNSGGFELASVAVALSDAIEATADHLPGEATRRLKENAAAFRAAMQTLIGSSDIATVKRAAVHAIELTHSIMAGTHASAATIKNLGPDIEKLQGRYQTDSAREAQRLPEIDEILVRLRSGIKRIDKESGSRFIAKEILPALNAELGKKQLIKQWPTIDLGDEKKVSGRIEAIKKRLDRFDKRSGTPGTIDGCP